MNIIKPNFEIIEQQPDINGIYTQIEIAGRICYKSEDKITDSSAEKFVDRMIVSGHGAMLEHGTVYLKLDKDYVDEYGRVSYATFKGDYQKNKYSKISTSYYDFIPECTNFCKSVTKTINYVTTNYRVLIENNWLDDLQYLCEPTEYHEKRVTVKFTMDRIGSQSFVRHRVNSYAQESTRFCNYFKSKFQGSVSFIMPCYIKDEDLQEAERDLKEAEEKYFKWIKKGYTAEQARFILPFALKTELIMTGSISDWKHFFKLRCDTAAHPQARELAIPLEEEFKNRKYI